MFPQWFFSLIVYLSIALTAAGVATLLALLFKDRKSKSLW